MYVSFTPNTNLVYFIVLDITIWPFVHVQRTPEIVVCKPFGLCANMSGQKARSQHT